MPDNRQKGNCVKSEDQYLHDTCTTVEVATPAASPAAYHLPTFGAASRLSKSRPLRRDAINFSRVKPITASRLSKSRPLRPQGRSQFKPPCSRLTIVEVATPAASHVKSFLVSKMIRLTIVEVATPAAGELHGCDGGVCPPHDCRSRDPCGTVRSPGIHYYFPPHDCRSRDPCGRSATLKSIASQCRLTIVEVATPAANSSLLWPWPL